MVQIPTGWCLGLALFDFSTQTPERIQEVEPPILDSNLYSYGADCSNLSWIYCLDPPRGLGSQGEIRVGSAASVQRTWSLHCCLVGPNPSFFFWPYIYIHIYIYIICT